MRAVLQRVQKANVKVNKQLISEIGQGVLIFLGIHKNDLLNESKWLSEKIANLRFFSDEAGKMNLSLKEVGQDALVISQFTLYANCKNGRRPDFFSAMPPLQAEEIYKQFITDLKSLGINTKEGIFGAEMEISLINDGPVTLIIEK